MPAFILSFLSLLFIPILTTDSLAESRLRPPHFFHTDDLDYKGLESALEKSCRYYDSASQKIFELCDQRLSGHEISRSYSQIIRSLEKQTRQDVSRFLSENFTACVPTSLLVTGYYSPIMPGSLSPSTTFRFPLYAPPAQKHMRGLSRAEINNDTRLAGLEIAYLSDPLDLFFLHVQGSGILKLSDGSSRLVSYAGDNGLPYTSIGKILIKEGKLRRKDVSLGTIRRYLTEHPEQMERILNHNERFIFFKLSTPVTGDIVPEGSLGYGLTPGRSVAMDTDHYPPGILGTLTSRRPLIDENGNVSWQPFSRLVTHQDSGSAIKGPHRLDLYMGSGHKAGQAAGLMKEKGSFAILIPNLSLRRVHSRIVINENVARSPTQRVPLIASGE